MTHGEMSFSELIQSMIPDEVKGKIDYKPISDHEYAQLQCDWYNNREGNLTGFDCPKCKNRGNFQVLDAEDNHVIRECSCMAQRKYIAAMNAAGLSELYEKCTFDTYTVSNDFQKTCKERVMRYAAKEGNGWLWISGQSGIGKTHLCTAVCSELAKRGRGIKYVQWKPLYNKLVQTKFKLEEQDQIMNELIHADVLYLDDFLKTPNNIAPNSEMLSYALEIIDARYKGEKKTILSTEFVLDDILKFDEALGSRISERTAEFKVQVLRQEGRNYRRKGK